MAAHICKFPCEHFETDLKSQSENKINSLLRYEIYHGKSSLFWFKKLRMMIYYKSSLEVFCYTLNCNFSQSWSHFSTLSSWIHVAFYEKKKSEEYQLIFRDGKYFYSNSSRVCLECQNNYNSPSYNNARQ